MTTYCWDGRTLATDCPDGVVILMDGGKAVHLQPGTVAAFGEHAAAALGALSCGATSARALETGPKVAEALTTPVMVTETDTIELQEVQDATCTTTQAPGEPERPAVPPSDAAPGSDGTGAGLGGGDGADKRQGRRRRTAPQD